MTMAGGEALGSLSRSCRSTYPQAAFPQRFPFLKEYRHTLAEETKCLQLVVTQVKTNLAPEKLHRSLTALLALDANHMLEAWILLQGTDAGIAQDYTRYRETHRGQLRTFIA